MSGIAIFNAAVNQLQQSQSNLMKMRAARQKLEFDKEDQEFQRKKNDIELEDAKRKGVMSDLQYDILKEQQKAYNKQQDEISKGKLAQIKVLQHQTKTTADEAMNWAKIGFKSDPQGVTSFLQANQRNKERQQMIVPDFSYGRIGYTTKNIDRPDAGYTRKDVVAQANKMAEQGPRGSMPGDYMAEAEALLRGEQSGDGLSVNRGAVPARPVRGMNPPEPEKPIFDEQGNPVPKWKQIKMQREGKSVQPVSTQSKFKPGDIRTKNGVKYKRNGNGEWLPVR